MAGEANGLVEARGLRKTYKGGGSGKSQQVRALDGLSFSVPAGTVYALLGPNGAGKTTTVRILTTLSRPDEGSATVAGIDVLAQPGKVRSAIGAVSQHSGAIGLLTGQENLAMQGRLYGLGGRDLRRRVAELLDAFGLTEAADRQAGTYSGGMRRRLDIATVLVHRPAVLFLDEPTTGLDPEGRADLWAVLTELAASGTTILVTTHYLEEADQYAAKIAIVDRGRIVAEGTSDQLKAELAGDSVLLELDSAERAEKAGKVLLDMPEVVGASADGATVRARVANGPHALPAVLGGLEASDVGVRSVTVARPSLDDVYLHYAGRSFGQAERTVS
ncbi:MAG TPA: ATP-binding cassette domain-containing protein [Streptosporangiaceae bacterium]|nr:ATP-binding cassette domain-containing protein [Streptosporangiaceae bacterium]